MSRLPVFSPVSFLTFGLLVLLPSALAGAVLPQHYPPQNDPRQGPQVDPDLKIWLGDHVDQLQVPLVDDASYRKLLDGSDKLTRLFIELQRGPAIIKGQRISDVAAAVEQEIGIAKKESRPVHPMLPYIIQVLTIRSILPEKDIARFELMLSDVAPRSCPGRRQFLKSIAKERLDQMAEADLQAAFSKIRDFRFQAFRRQAYDVFLSNISAARRDLLKPLLVPALPDVEPALGRHAWLATMAEGLSGDKSRKPLAMIKAELKEGRCKEAATVFNDFLDKDESFFSSKKPAGLADEVLSAGQNIGRCFRKRGVAPAVAFWTDVMPRLEKSFGFQGKAGALQRIASLYWNADQMEEAKSTARQLRDEAKAAKDTTRTGTATFLLARILDDNRERKDAKELYGEYVASSPDDENFETGVSTLTLMRYEDGNYQEIIDSLSGVIRRQDMLPPAAKSSSLLGFALFWSGRAHAALKRQDLAQHHWRRLSMELYSTYYGVLGHLMYERGSSRKFMIEPSRTPRFTKDFLVEPYTGEDRVAMLRIAGLLRTGLTSEAICELREVVTDEADPDQTSARALALYAGKEWLDAIKLMDSLPRSFRNALPAGFERIFFPRDHENLVHDYARRLGADPDFIFAIIRQESVFNPRAQSPVGATGLMQLMPATARGEFQKLGKGYVGPEKRERIARAVKGGSNLSDPEVNVALGVHHVHRLMGIYKNPVLMLSAYNASPSAADKWSREIPFDDPLAAIERIPYQETRNYVKLIMRNYFYYKRWYVTARPQMPYLDYILGKPVKN